MSTKEWYQKNKARVRKNQREYENTPRGWAVRQVSALKYRAKKMSLDFNLDTEYVESLMIPYCPALGYKLQYSILPGNKYKKRKDAASIDRIDSSLGYTKGNVQILSWQANLIKQNATDSELRLFANWVLSRKGETHG